ncbi:right-handed parallel beta-helix repeat-containing protein [Myxococcota bacterium]|nr:right-handed parallel beta-helix repeat-containing protein [Myxococcota bacterium]MBU1898469.1 right-handed parallel beta-helix repeat-containing protein [Myxococcota bacterium]
MRSQIALILTVAFAIRAQAAPIEAPHAFADGEIISAEEMNDNFEAVVQGINAQDDANEALETRVAALEAALEAAEARIATLEAASQGDALAGQVGALDARVSVAEEDITALQSSVGANTAAIALNTASIEATSTEVAVSQAGVSTNTEAIAVHSIEIEANRAGVTANAEALALQNTAIEAHVADIAANTAGVAANAEALSLQNTAIEAHVADIAANAAGVAANTEALASQNTVIEAQVADIAANAANIASGLDLIAANANAVELLQSSNEANDGRLTALENNTPVIIDELVRTFGLVGAEFNDLSEALRIPENTIVKHLIIQVLPGEYQFNEPLVIENYRNELTIIGNEEAPGMHVLNFPDSNGIMITDSDHINLIGLGLSSDFTSVSSNRGVELDLVEKFTLRNVNIANFNSTAIYSSYSTIIASNLNINHCTVGIFSTSSNVMLSDVNIFDISYWAIYAGLESIFSINSSEIEGLAYAFYLENSSTMNSINSTFSSDGTPSVHGTIVLGQTSFMKLEGSTVTNASRSCIYVGSNAQLVMKNSTVENCALNGVRVRESTGAIYLDHYPNVIKDILRD